MSRGCGVLHEVRRDNKLAFAVTINATGVRVCSPDGEDVTEFVARIDRDVRISLWAVKSLYAQYWSRVYVYDDALSAMYGANKRSAGLDGGKSALEELVRFEVKLDKIRLDLQCAIEDLKWALRCRVKTKQAQPDSAGALVS